MQNEFILNEWMNVPGCKMNIYWMNEWMYLVAKWISIGWEKDEEMNVPGNKMNIYWMRKVCNISSFWVINLKQRLFQNQSGLRKTFQTPESRNHYVSVLKIQDPLHKNVLLGW